jgi:PAS domain S-box-containing protein
MVPSVEQLLLRLAEQTKELAIILLDPDGTIRWWGPGAEQIFGLSQDEATGSPYSRLFICEDVELGLAEHEIAVAKANSSAEDDRWLARADGSRFWSTGILVALRNERGELLGFGKVIRNRTDLKEQLESLRQQAEAAVSANQRKDVFLYTLSHELRNPLAPLASAVQIIRMTAARSPEIETSLRVIERQVECLQRLVGDMLDLSRIGAGKVEIHKSTIPIHEVIGRAVESARPAVRERRHHLEVLLPPGIIWVEADPIRLEQIFLNLIQNAAKYTPERGRITVKATVEGHEASIRVEDNGIGIPPDMLPRIFDLFTQVEAARSRADGGLGIGLSLVKELVTLHGGSVQVRSDGPGKGSEFTIRLPLAPASDSPAAR